MREVGIQKSGFRKRIGRPFCLLPTACCLLCAIAQAAPTQEDIFRSLQDNLSEPSDATPFMAIVFAAAGVILLLLVLSYRRKREVAPKTLNHPGKLLKEISKAINLKPAHVRQLKLIAEEQSLKSPITLLLCPSILTRTMKQKPASVDRRLLSSIMRETAETRKAAA